VIELILRDWIPLGRLVVVARSQEVVHARQLNICCTALRIEQADVYAAVTIAIVRAL